MKQFDSKSLLQDNETGKKKKAQKQLQNKQNWQNVNFYDKKGQRLNYFN